MHPLVGNLSVITNSQIEEKIIKLQRMYFSAANPQVQDQIVTLLDTYNLELEERRIREQIKRQDDGNSLDDLINVT
jgi:hypothetical protein